MKLSFIFLVASLINITAAVYPQNVKFNFKLENVTIKDVLNEVENNSPYKFLYRNEFIDVQQKVNINANNETLSAILDKLFKSESIVYRIFEGNIVVITDKSLQQTKVSGKVTDASTGEPLPGVNIVIKGTTDGTITDFDGNYTIDVPATNTELVFSYVGYLAQTVTLTGNTTVNVALEPDVTDIDEIVVVGYGTMKRTDVTGSVVSVSSEEISKSVSTSLDQALQGRAAGVQIMQNSGTPGGSSSIRIRGINSLNASNEPIFVIDGVIIDGSTNSGNSNALSSINPADILTIDVLKDASATAIYGSRASNGVILITTKKGSDGKARITYDVYTGWQEMPKKLDLLNLQEYAIHKNKRAELGIVEADNNFVRADLLGEGTDWQDELFTKAMMTNHNLSVAGGTEKISYALGLGYLDQEGIAIGSGFDRLSIRGNFDAKINDFLKTGVNFTFSNSKQKTTVSDQSLIKTALKQTPVVAVRNAEGTFDGPDDDQYVQNNPVGLAMLNDNRNERAGILANTYLEATIIKGLTFKTEISLDYNTTNTYTFDPSYTFGAIVREIREGSRSKTYSKYRSLRNILTYNKQFDIHNINVMLGQEMQESSWEYLYSYRSGYLSNEATNIDAGDATTAKNSGSDGKSSISSFFGRAFYSYNDKYLITATLRRDGSSKFYNDNRWGWFPSVALAWKISNESFMENVPFINNLKLRLGWGKVGNQNVNDNYAYTSIYSAVATANWGTGVLASNTPNKDLQWETTSSSNIGLDLNLFDNRIEFIADVYYKKTDNLLLQLPLPSYVGTTGQGSASAPWANIGSLENKGIELTLNTVNINKNGFNWRSSFVFSMNRNKVLSLDTETSLIDKTIQEGSDITIITRTAVGEPIGRFYGYKIIGRFESATDFYYRNENGDIVPTALPEDLSIGENGVWIGDYMFADMNNDGVINEEDRTYIGNPEPVSVFGIGNNFSYKGFELSIYLTGVYGNEVVNYQRRWLENPRENTNLLNKAIHYADLELIDPDGPNDYRNVHIVGGDSDMPRIAASSAASSSNFRFSDKFIEDGSYLRIQSISFAYNFPQRWINRFHIQSLRFYTNLQNVYTFTKYSGYDPEIGSLNQDALMTGIDNARYPMPRIYTFGLNITL